MLDNTPGADMLEFFPDMMGDLFLLLGDGHREIVSVGVIEWWIE